MSMKAALRAARDKITGTSDVLKRGKQIHDMIECNTATLSKLIHKMDYIDLKLTMLNCVDSPERADEIECLKRRCSLADLDEAPDPAQYVIDGFVLEMGKGHKLPKTQVQFPMYDRFVPYLGELANGRQNMGGGGNH